MVTLHKIQLTGRITESGELKIDDLPEGLPPGEVQVTLEVEVPAEEEIPWEDRPWTDEEIKEMMTITPKTGAEIVARLEKEGGWEDKGITDGAEWVQEQRRKRREKNRW
jgi:hypothetical protein